MSAALRLHANGVLRGALTKPARALAMMPTMALSMIASMARALTLSIVRPIALPIALPIAISIVLAIVTAPGAHADIWKRVDQNGMSHFSNQHMGKGSVLVVRTKPSSAPRGAAGSSTAPAKILASNKDLYTPLIEKAARQFHLDADLIHAVVRAESAYNAAAQSNKGAVGLMQLMPGTAQRYGVGDRTDPMQNLRGGVNYLRDLMLQFRNIALALAAYNAGENAVIRHGNKIPPYEETQNYVQKVIGFYLTSNKPS